MDIKLEEVTEVKTEEPNFWEHQKFGKCTPEKGGGEVIAVDESNSSVQEMYARMVSSGVLQSTVAHASAGARMSQERAEALIEGARRCPQYSELIERESVKRIVQKALKAEQLRKETEEEKTNEQL